MSHNFMLRPLLGAVLVLPALAVAQPAAETDVAQRLQQLQQQIDALRAASPAPRAPAVDIGLILSGRYAHLRQDPETWRLQGFVPVDGEIGPGERGLTLEEAELVLSAAIDPRFKGTLTLAVTPDEGVEVEEARVDSTGLGAGVSVRFGRFLSGIGYLNEQHKHSWEFADAPLMAQAFYGGVLRQDGVQLRWVTPLPYYLELGAELASGAAWPGVSANRNGLGSHTLFARTGADLGEQSAWQGSLWYQTVRVSGREHVDSNSLDQEVINSFSGDSDSWGASLVYKWSPVADMRQQGLKLQLEYMQRREDGQLEYDLEGTAQGTQSGDWSLQQAGAYAQATWRFDRSWRTGVRYDWLDAGDTEIGLVQQGSLQAEDFSSLLPHNPRRTSVMLEYAHSEFSQFRLQFMRDESRGGEADNQVMLQYTMSLGAHPAHAF